IHVQCAAAPRSLPSFPTRRSSDLRLAGVGLIVAVPSVDSVGILVVEGGSIAIGFIGVAAGFSDATTGVTAGGAIGVWATTIGSRSEEHTSELQSRFDLVCRLLLEK